MRRALVWIVGLLYASAWFLQVVEGGDTLADGTLPGWQALRLSLSPLWGDFNGSFLQGTLCVLSGLSNLVFVAGWARLLLRPAASPRRLSRVLLGAAALNTYWILDPGEPEGMRAGYWLWLASFALLGLVARLRRSATE